MNEYVFDFETNTTEETCGLNPVWAWGYAAVDDPENTYRSGTSINSFIDFIENKPGRYWAHNVGFDAKFVLDYIMKHGYKWVDGSPNVGEFTTLIDRMGKFYSVTIRFESGEVVLAFDYQSECHCSKTVSWTGVLPWRFDYQSECHCSKTHWGVYSASRMFDYQSECHCSKTRSQLGRLGQEFDYQSECHCSKTT